MQTLFVTTLIYNAEGSFRKTSVSENSTKFAEPGYWFLFIWCLPGCIVFANSITFPRPADLHIAKYSLEKISSTTVMFERSIILVQYILTIINFELNSVASPKYLV